MENDKTQVSDYYAEKRIELIEKLKLAVDQCLTIVGENIDEDITDDKLHNVLKGKKMASEDTEYYMQQIKKYENEINGVVEEEKTDSGKPKNWSKEFAKKPN
jgi:hypothetical protein